jgi:transposase-like protein
VKVAGRWVYLYRAIDQFGQVIDVLVSQKRDLAATRRFFTRALEHSPRPSEVTTESKIFGAATMNSVSIPTRNDSSRRCSPTSPSLFDHSPRRPATPASRQRNSAAKTSSAPQAQM